MKSGNSRFCFYALLLAILCLSVNGLAQEKSARNKGFCENYNYSNGDKVSFKELREVTIPAQSLLTVDGRQNGGIRVKGSNRSDVLVRACVQAMGETEEAAASLAKNIRIETGSTIRAESSADENWSVSYEIHVPRATNLKLNAHNGGIGITGVEGNLDFETLNGGLHLSDLGGNVRGRTTNGGLHVELSGTAWRGAGLDLQTTNGGVHVSMPDSYAANIETGTVNGGFHSSLSGLQAPERKERGHRAVRLNTTLNGGGAPVRLITTNGGVHIKASDKSVAY